MYHDSSKKKLRFDRSLDKIKSEHNFYFYRLYDIGPEFMALLVYMKLCNAQ